MSDLRNVRVTDISCFVGVVDLGFIIKFMDLIHFELQNAYLKHKNICSLRRNDKNKILVSKY